MQTQYIPEDRFPIQVSPHVQVLGNYYFNLMLITGKEKSLLFEAGVAWGWLTTIMSGLISSSSNCRMT